MGADEVAQRERRYKGYDGLQEGSAVHATPVTQKADSGLPETHSPQQSWPTQPSMHVTSPLDVQSHGLPPPVAMSSDDIPGTQAPSWLTKPLLHWKEQPAKLSQYSVPCAGAAGQGVQAVPQL